MEMPPTPDTDLPRLKVTTGWTSIEVVSEPGVIATFRGYVPAVIIKTTLNDLKYTLALGAKSLMDYLEPRRQNNRGHFSGIRLRLRKESDAQMAKYEASDHD
jgi:hypothetical protein